MSRHDIERHFQKAVPFLVGCLSVLVVILLPLVISIYMQISTKGKLYAYHLSAIDNKSVQQSQILWI